MRHGFLVTALVTLVGLDCFGYDFALRQRLSPPLTSSDVSRLLQLLQGSGRGVELCAPTNDRACTFEEACRQIPLNREGPYLYQSAQGHQVINDAYAQFAREALNCGLRSYGPFALSPYEDDYDRWRASVSSDQARAVERFLEGYADGIFVKIVNREPVSDVLSESQFLARYRAFVAQQPQGWRERLNAGAQAILNRASTPPPAPFINWEAITPPELMNALENPFINPLVLRDPEARGERARAQVRSRQEVVARQGSSIQLAFLDLLRKRQLALPSGSPEWRTLERMAERVGTIRLDFRPSEQDLEKFCQTPNAFYDPMSHTFKLCPSLLGATDGLLARVIAHEIAHSIDPCNMAGSFYRLEDQATGLDPFASAETAYAAVSPVYTGYVPDGGVLAQGGSPFSASPYRPVMACLERQAGLRPTSLAWLRGKLQELRGQRVAEVSRPDNVARIDERIRELGQTIELAGKQDGASLSRIQRFPYCSEFGSQHQEAFADLLASEAIGAMSPQGRTLVDYIDANECTRDTQQADALKQRLEALGCRPVRSFDPIDTHLHEDQRVDLTLVRDQGLRQALGCSPLPSQEACLDH